MDGEIKLPIEVVDNATAALNGIIKSFNKFKDTTDDINKKSNAFDNLVKNGDKVEGILNTLGVKTTGFMTSLSKMANSPTKLGMLPGLAEGTKQLMDMSDKATTLQGKLALALDQGSSVNAFKEKMFQAANESRTSFDAIAEGVTGIGMAAGDMFNDDELLKFTQSLSTLYKIGGATGQEVQASMVQIRQALAKGKLQGDEFKSLSSLPGFLDLMADKLGVSKGEVKELASEGKITAQVFKEAMLEGADGLQKKLDTIPKTFGDRINEVNNSMEKFRNTIGLVLNKVANCAIIRIIFGAVIKVFENLTKIVNVSIALFDKLKKVTKKYTKPIGDIINKLGGLETVIDVLGNVLTAILLPILAVLIGKFIILGIQALIAGVKMFFSAMMALGPIGLVIIAILAIIGVLVALGVNFQTIFGYIGGVVGVTIAGIWNLFLALFEFVLGIINYLGRYFMTFANFFGNLFNDPVASIIYLIRDMVNTILSLVHTVAKALDKVFGTNLAKGVKGWMDGVDKMADKAAKKYGNGSYEGTEWEDLSADSFGLKRMEYGKMWDSGFKIGSDIGAGLDSLIDKFGSGVGTSIDMSGVGGANTDLSDYDASTGKGSLSTKMDDDTIDELKAFAEIQYRLNYKHITPNVNVKFGDVRETADLDDITAYIKKMMNEDLEELYILEGE